MGCAREGHEAAMKGAGMKPLFVLVVGTLVAGCGGAGPSAESPGQPLTLSSGQISKIQAGVRVRLKDPDSARFSRIVAGRMANGRVIACGQVNAKNSFGGYTGMSPFVADLSDSTSAEVVGVEVLRDDFGGIVSGHCRKAGIELPSAL